MTAGATLDPTLGPTFFKTDRLHVRRFEESDLDALATINRSPVVSRYVDDGKPLSRADTVRWIKTSRANVSRFGYGTGAVVLRSTGQLIGWAGFARGADPTDRDDEEIVYGLDEPWWGKGYGTELITALVFYGIKTLALPRLRATVYQQNLASIRLLKRQGFKLSESNYDGVQGVDLYVLDPSSAAP